MLVGVDVSHHQDPDRFSPGWSEHVDFLIARATYGVRSDKRFPEFAQMAREAGVVFGAYHFYRQSQRSTEQLEAFDGELKRVSYGEGDLLPAFDLERNEDYDGKFNPILHRNFLHIASDWAASRGYGVYLYTNVHLHEAHFAVRLPFGTYLWLAAWDNSTAPRDADIWQHHVGEWRNVYDGIIDINQANRLVKIQRAKPEPLLARLETIRGQLDEVIGGLKGS